MAPPAPLLRARLAGNVGWPSTLLCMKPGVSFFVNYISKVPILYYVFLAICTCKISKKINQITVLKSPALPVITVHSHTASSVK